MFYTREIQRPTSIVFLSSDAGKRSPLTGRTELHICQRPVTGLNYRDNAIEHVVVLYARRHGNALIFQDDSARAHRALLVQDHPQFRRITTLPWPARSLDLSPIERLWDILGKRVRRRPHKPQDINELADARQQEWCRIPQETAGRLYRSMRRCGLACPLRY